MTANMSGRMQRQSDAKAEADITASFAPQPRQKRSAPDELEGESEQQAAPAAKRRRKLKRDPKQPEAEKAALQPNTPGMQAIRDAQIKRERITSIHFMAYDGTTSATLRAGTSFVLEDGVYYKQKVKLDFLGRPMLDQTSRDFVEESRRLIRGRAALSGSENDGESGIDVEDVGNREDEEDDQGDDGQVSEADVMDLNDDGTGSNVSTSDHRRESSERDEVQKKPSERLP